MIVRHFIGWVRTAPAGERAEATRALARAWLVSNLNEDDIAAAEGALLMLLDDPSPLVRQAMAETFAWSADAPPAIVRALACDQPSVALPILECSPLLLDADLVDIVAQGGADVQCAVARRFDLPSPVAAAIAEVGCPAAVLELLENPEAAVLPFSIERVAERHGHIAPVREVLLGRDDLSSTTRLKLVAKVSETLLDFVTSRGWICQERAVTIARETGERATMTIAADAGRQLADLVEHLRQAGQLSAGLILRALLSGNVALFEAALANLSGLSSERVAGIVSDRTGRGLDALFVAAGLPSSTIPAFRAALNANHEFGFVGNVGDAARLRRRVVERVLTRCEFEAAFESGPLLILLRRFATEAAREEARLFCDELAFEDSVQFAATDLLAA